MSHRDPLFGRTEVLGDARHHPHSPAVLFCIFFRIVVPIVYPQGHGGQMLEGRTQTLRVDRSQATSLQEGEGSSPSLGLEPMLTDRFCL